MRGIVLTVVLAALAAAALPAVASAKPIVYVVVIDGLDGDAVDAGKAPFISSLLGGDDANAAYFPRSRSVIPAETNPNHTAMMTGAFPGRSGIAANAFALYRPLLNEDTCESAGPLDLSVVPTETSGESPTCPKAEMLFQAGRRQKGKRHPVTAVVMGKPKLGRIFDVSYRGKRAADYLWAPCASGPEDDSYCTSVATNPVTGYALTDTIVMDEVMKTMDGVPVGNRVERPDFTFVNLPVVDSAGHANGRGPLYDGAVALADAEIQRLVGELESRDEWRRTALILVSDHSMDSTPQRISLTSEFTGADIGEDEFLAVQNGSYDSIYLGDRVAPAAERGELLERMREVALDQPGVAEAWYRQRNVADHGLRFTARKRRPGWRARGNRLPDLAVIARPGWAFSEPDLTANPLPGNHGSPFTADNFLAVTGGWDKIAQRTVTGSGRRAAVRNVDLAPTVARLLGLRPPRDNAGRPLRAAFKRGTLSD